MNTTSNINDLPTVFAVGVDETEWAATSIVILVGVASAAVQARLSGTRMIAVAHVDPSQRLLEQLDRPLVDHQLHGRHGNSIITVVSIIVVRAYVP